VQAIRDFFIEIDRLWSRPAAHGQKIRLSIIGSGALMLQASYERGTKDSDVLDTLELSGEIGERLRALAGGQQAGALQRE
jgi:hypothetical protein